MATKTRFLRLDTLVAYMQTESDGDEVFLKYKDEKVAPSNGKYMKMSKDPVPLDVEIPIAEGEQWVELELWDYDHFSANDSLGKFRFLVDEVAEDFTAELQPTRDSIARYVLSWSVVERLDGKKGRG